MDTIKKFEPFFGEWHAESFIGESGRGRVYKIRRGDRGKKAYSALEYISIPADKSEIDKLRAEGLSDEAIRARFSAQLKELKAQAERFKELGGEDNTVRIEDIKALPKEEGPGFDLLIRTEPVEPLTAKLASRPLTSAETVKLGTDICAALEALKKRGIVHGDIRPENVFVNNKGDYKLGAPGLEKPADEADHMAPEVYNGEKPSASADICSLGLIMYSLFNDGRLPFMPSSPEPVSEWDRENAVARRMAGDKLPDPANADPKLAAAVLKACAFDPKDRYTSPAVMREALLIRSGASGSSAAAAAAVGADNTQKTVNTAQPSKEAEEKKRKTILTAAIAAAVLCGVLALLALTGILGKLGRNGKHTAANTAEPTGTVSAETAAPTPEMTETTIPTEVPVTDTPAPTPEPSTEPAEETETAPSETPMPTEEATPSALPSDTPAATTTPRPSYTPTPRPSASPVSTVTPQPSETVRPSDSAAPSETPQPSETVQPSDTPKPTNTPKPTATPTPKPTATPTPKPDPVVTFADAAFESALRSKYDLSGTIHESDLLAFTELRLENSGLKNISDVAKFKNLQKLYLNDNKNISDISAVSGLTKLEWLFIGNNKISDISALSGLKNMKMLSMNKNDIGSITALKGLTKLQYLNLADNTISSVSALKNLTVLEHLDLTNNNVSDVADLKGLKKLNYLALKGNPLTQDQIDWLHEQLPNCTIVF